MSGLGLQIVTPQAVGRLTVASSGGLWLSLIDRGACAIHGCATLGAWYSGDGGRGWEQTALPAVEGQGCSGLGFNMPAVAQSGDGPVYAVAGGGTAACPPAPSILSRWDGSGWQVVHSWGPATVSGISWPSGRQSYVVINDALARTLDAGRKWSQVWPPAFQSHIRPSCHRGDSPIWIPVANSSVIPQ